MLKFWHSTGHVLAHIGLGLVSAGAAAGYIAPPPFNAIIVGGSILAQVIIAKTHKPTI